MSPRRGSGVGDLLWAGLVVEEAPMTPHEMVDRFVTRDRCEEERTKIWTEITRLKLQAAYFGGAVGVLIALPTWIMLVLKLMGKG